MTRYTKHIIATSATLVAAAGLAGPSQALAASQPAKAAPVALSSAAASLRTTPSGAKWSTVASTNVSAKKCYKIRWHPRRPVRVKVRVKCAKASSAATMPYRH